MLKSILEIGTPLSKTEQQFINGGGICCSYYIKNCCTYTKPWHD